MRTKYEDKRLGDMSMAQLKSAERLHAEPLGLCITGILKAATRKKVFLIARSGRVTFEAKRGRYGHAIHD